MHSSAITLEEHDVTIEKEYPFFSVMASVLRQITSWANKVSLTHFPLVCHGLNLVIALICIKDVNDGCMHKHFNKLNPIYQG